MAKGQASKKPSRQAPAVARRGHKRPLAPQRAFAAILGLRTHDVVDILKRIEGGLPFDALARFQRRIGLPSAKVAELTQIPLRTLTRRRALGRLRPDESDRLIRASRLFENVVELFEGDVEAARRWVTSPQKALAGATPLAFTKTELGAREVENLVGRLEHGVFS